MGEPEREPYSLSPVPALLPLLEDSPQTVLHGLQLGLYPLKSTLLSPTKVIFDFHVIGSHLTWLLSNIASALHSLLSSTPSSLGFLTSFWFPSYLSGPFFLMGFSVFLLCMLSTPTWWRCSWLSPCFTSLFQLCFYPRWSHPNSWLPDGYRLLHLYLQARFLYKLEPVYPTAYSIFIS